MANYVIGTGYYCENARSEKFLERVWWPNTCKYARPAYNVIVSSASPMVKLPLSGNNNCQPTWINLPVNPQCGRRLKKDVPFSGWALGFIQGALFAYSCGCDFIYKEQDCLTFGPWVEKLYEDADRFKYSMVCGELVQFPTAGYLEQCLVLLKYNYILPFLAALLAIEQGEARMKPEQKFSHVMQRNPLKCGFFSLVGGGNRPFCEDDPVFYIQKPRWDYKIRQQIKTDIGSLVPDDELLRLSEKGLLAWPPKGTKTVDWT